MPLHFSKWRNSGKPTGANAIKRENERRENELLAPIKPNTDKLRFCWRGMSVNYVLGQQNTDCNSEKQIDHSHG